MMAAEVGNKHHRVTRSVPISCATCTLQQGRPTAELTALARSIRHKLAKAAFDNLLVDKPGFGVIQR
jgi:hypothetical protein